MSEILDFSGACAISKDEAAELWRKACAASAAAFPVIQKNMS
jgi:hypothetical protein